MNGRHEADTVHMSTNEHEDTKLGASAEWRVRESGEESESGVECESGVWFKGKV